ncbi:hypothetical protein LN475_14790 [Xanthomonas vesicatoria]|uniref:Uncharacterized protein n=1 Tax=Xanthomonas vesicatoria ATCC 35937 TaxID=925775 RepID=F0BIT9_9XANT|nr:hypothetical protein [Xanthomonas vesicatoria]EGD07605.1 hypothetical protein XVE_4195 [Xanthomonas vesicatoria ATCC 35937]KTF36110.1 hypothetical protein LMG920_00060 [Xanthomonas vesicatoria]MCC8597912.1 hypothetical protein [Xanthomonas vesicatoria]MCC8604780.1 hypothetical protein [Xanthomonas vesicatoria]
MAVENNHNNRLERLGFSYERGGVHTARTMMLVELRTLLSFVHKADAPRVDYLEAVHTANCLGKRSGKTRTLTFRHLADLYALDPSLLVFRALRFFWQRDVDGQPLSAALCASTRDPMFRATAPFVLGFQEGATITRELMEEFIDAQEPGRFSKATLKSTAQNINSSWTQSGHLSGRVRKVRARAVATPGAVSVALLLGYVSGLRGESLFKSDYTKMLECSFERTIELAEDASRRSWISLKRVGQVVEVLFPNLITAQEQEWLREPN